MSSLKVFIWFLAFAWAQDSSWIYYYPSGNIKEEASYKNEKLHGTWKTFYESGDVAIEGYFNEGIHTGIWKLYYESGSLKATGIFDSNNDEFDGYCVYYYDNNGPKMSEGPFIHRLEHGFWKMYYPSGSLALESTYAFGRQVSYTNYTES